MSPDQFLQFGLLLVLTAAISTAMKLLRQPLIIGYIAAGLIVGPQVLGLFEVNETFRAFSHLGIALLLFIIGLGLNPRVIREVGRAAFITGIGQVVFTAAFGYAITRALNYSATEAFYLAMALTLSSTIIIVKVLSDKRETNQLYAKIVTGLLLVQDLVATVLLIVVGGDKPAAGNELVEQLVFGGVLAATMIMMAVYVLPRIQKFIASSQEYLFVFAIAWGFGIASLFAIAGLSIEVGALFAGIVLAPQAFAQEVSARLRSLRDFFVIVFFIVLGAQINFMIIGNNLLPAILLSAFVLIGNPLIVMTLMGLMGYTKKTAFKASMTVAQISEFSLVLVILAESLGKVGPEIVATVTLVGVITIAASTYMMLFDETLFRWSEHYLTLFERRYVRREKHYRHRSDIILFGYKHGGHEFVHAFEKLKKNYLVVDYDPEVIEDLKSTKQAHAYGDANDAEFLDEIDLEKAHLVISAMTDFKTNLFLVTHLRAHSDKTVCIVHAEKPEEAMRLYEHGATYVMMPHFISSEQIGRLIGRVGIKQSDFDKVRGRHLAYVQKQLA